MARRGTHFSHEEWAFVDDLLREHWSPEQIEGWCARFAMLAISHETIYRHVWADQKQGGMLYPHLRIITKHLRKRYGAYDRRGRLAGKRHSSTRPRDAEQRTRLGHWEGDTVHGSTQHNACIVTMVERTSGFLAIGQLDRCGAAKTPAHLTQLIAAQPHPVRTLTLDYGTEFHGDKQLEARVATVCYFATPHHAWERGSNENVNGLVRRS